MKLLMLSVVLLLASCGKEEPKVTGPIIERAKDPVCGMWVEKKPAPISIVVIFDKACYYFCADSCAATFAKEPTKYTTPCNCSKIKRDCKCEHCQGKMVPCDCQWH